MRSLAPALALLLAVALSACGGGEPAESPDSAASESAATEATDDATEESAGSGDAGEEVAVVDFGFEPADVSVAAGDAVSWSYEEGRSQHNVTFEDDEVSDTLEPGDTYERTFDEAGEYPYACTFHPNMTATVTVE